MSIELHALAQELRAISDPDLFWEQANLALNNYGVTSIFYGAIATKADTLAKPTTKSVTWKCNHTHEFVDYFGENRLLDNDLSFEHALRETDLFKWHDLSQWEDASKEQRAQGYAEREMGLYVGFTLPTTYFCNHHYGAMGVSMAEFSPEEYEKFWPEKHVELMQVLSLLDAGMREQHLKHVIGLAPREKETMEWLASGKRPDQIADLMKIGYRTVDKYIDSSKRKLKARTRDQAVAKALIFNVIEP